MWDRLDLVNYYYYCSQLKMDDRDDLDASAFEDSERHHQDVDDDDEVVGAAGHRGDRLSRSSSLQQILASISVERRRLSASTCSASRAEARPSRNKFWSQLLVQHFLDEDGEGDAGGGGGGDGDDFKDDLVFYVRRKPEQPQASGKSAGSTVEVHRKHKHNYKLIITDQLVDLEESVYLNLIMQQFAYTVTCAVCTRTGARELQILRRFTSRVFASPSRHCMDGKACREEITYPNIFFSVHNYDELFAGCVVRDSELLCVELVACDRRGRLQGVLFLGSIRYESVLEVYQARASGGRSSSSSSTPSSWLFGSASSLAGRRSRRVEFLRMRGPHGKGHAEVAVTAATADGSVVDESSAPGWRERRLSGSGGVVGVGGGGGGMKKSRSDSAHIDSAGGGSDEVRARPRRSRRRRPAVSACEVDGRAIEEEFVDEGDEPGVECRDDESGDSGAGGGISRGGEGGSGGGVWQLGRPFGQAWHWFRERRRADSVSLSACLTCVSLPWHRIVADLLDTRQQPVLAFDLPSG